MLLQDNKIVHFPDILFVKYCEGTYGVNRGIYNTIDEYFFQNGLDNVIQRRKMILEFFQYLKKCNVYKTTGKLVVGNKGLTMRLREFESVGVRT